MAYSPQWRALHWAATRRRGHDLNVSEYPEAVAVRRGAVDTFRHLVEQSPFGVYAVDADFRLVQVSAGAQKVFEQVRPLLGRNFAEVLRVIWPEPFASEAIGRFRHTLATGEAYHAPSTVERRRDVEAVEAYDWKIERVMLPEGRYGVVCHFYDLSERQRHEAELRDSEQHLRLALEAANAGSWTAVPSTGEFSASDRAMLLHGLERRSEITHATALACVHPEDVTRIRQAVNDAVAHGRPFRTEHRVRYPDGSIHWVASHAEVVDKDGQVRLVGLVQDITVRKNAEAVLSARQAEEHQISLWLQRALLPARLPDHPFVQVAAQYRAGSQHLEVGGDWYDAVALPDGRIALTVGDVMGHGLEAAAAMGQLRTAVAALASRLAPADMLTELDAFLTRTQVSDLVTLCYATYDPATGTLEYASAGHPPMLIVSPSGIVTRLQDATSPPLMHGSPWPRRQASTRLEPGTLLLMYSDGLIERRDQDLDSSLTHLQTLAGTLTTATPEDACRTVLTHTRPDATDDDIVILCARIALTRPEPPHRRPS